MNRMSASETRQVYLPRILVSDIILSQADKHSRVGLQQEKQMEGSPCPITQKKAGKGY